VNVLTIAMQQKGHEVRWFDRRKDPSCINLDQILGFIINTKSSWVVFSTRHWVALRKLDGKWLNFDSKKKTPEEFKEGEKGLLDYLRQILTGDAQVFIVAEKAKAELIYQKKTEIIESSEKKNEDIDSTCMAVDEEASKSRANETQSMQDITDMMSKLSN